MCDKSRFRLLKPGASQLPLGQSGTPTVTTRQHWRGTVGGRLVTLLVCAGLLACGDESTLPTVADAGEGDPAQAAAGGKGGTSGAGGTAGGGPPVAGTGGAGGDNAVGGSGGSVEACSGDGLSAGDHDGSLEHDGQAFDYVLHVPPGYDHSTPTPLVVNIHALMGSAKAQIDGTNFNTPADEAGYIVVYPNSPTASWDGGACCLSGGERDDVGFARALVAQVQAQLCVDDRRIYATGMSNGGFLSHRLACEATDLFAAVAPVAAVNGIADCSPSRPIPVLRFHGTVDSLVPYDGISGIFRNYISVEQSFSEWAARNDCTDAMPAETFRNGDAHCRTYAECADDAEVTLCVVDGMDHCWPAGACLSGVAPTDIQASETIVDFFGRHAMP